MIHKFNIVCAPYLQYIYVALLCLIIKDKNFLECPEMRIRIVLKLCTSILFKLAYYKSFLRRADSHVALNYRNKLVDSTNHNNNYN